MQKHSYRETLKMFNLKKVDFINYEERLILIAFLFLDARCGCGGRSLINHENAHLVNRNACGTDRLNISSSERIMGGNFSKRGEFPWVAQVWSKKFCGGSLISESWVLTAAHCVTKREPHCTWTKLKKVKVRLGVYDRSIDKPIIIDAEKVIVHKNLNPCRKFNDIALIKLVEPTKGTSDTVYNTVCLPLDYSEDLENLDVTVTGWGNTKVKTFPDGKWDSYSNSVILKKLDTKLEPFDDCQKTLSFKKYSDAKLLMEDLQICTKPPEGEGSCQGDSGGPLVTQSFDQSIKRWTQIGVLSYGGKCGAGNTLSVYTNVNGYMNWILDNIE